MAKELEYLLEEKIKENIENLSALTPGSSEHAKAVNSLEKLYKLKIEEVENERAFRARCDRDVMDERELQLKVNQLEEQRRSRWFNGAIQVGTSIGGLIAYDIWQRRGYKFEMNGTITTPWLRNLVSKMLPRR